MDKGLRRTIEKKFRAYGNLKFNDPWKNVIESVIAKYSGTEKGKLIECRYLKGKNEVQTCLELHISQRLYYDWVKDIIQDTALMAAYEKLIRP